MNYSTLIISPGLSSPFHISHESAYRSIYKEAIDRGYDAKILNHPGQVNEDGGINGELSLSSSIESLTSCILELEKNTCKYRLAGFSYGCYVIMAVLGRLSKLQNLEKSVLWGAPPLWVSWEIFVKGEGRDNVGKGTIISHSYFKDLEPIEYWLPKIHYPMTLALGENDEYITSSYIKYLESLVAENSNHEFKFLVVKGCIHTVENDCLCEDWKSYASTILD
jgi:hypothetical protein